MKMRSVLVLIIVGCSLPADAFFTDFDGSRRTTQTTTAVSHTSSWSWTSLKQRMIQAYHSWKNEISSSRMPASTAENAEQAPLPTAPISSEAQSAHKVTLSLRQAAEKVQTQGVTPVAKPAIPMHDKNLVMGRNHIPVFEFRKFKARIVHMRIKKVPLVNPGEEATIDGKAYSGFQIQPIQTISAKPVVKLSAPKLLGAQEFAEALGAPAIPAKPATVLPIPVLDEAKKVTAEKIAHLVYKLEPEMKYTALPVVHMTDEDLKLLRAMILFQRKDLCHIASGIFADLLSSQSKDVALKSEYALGVCLHEMNLPTEAMQHLSKVIKTGDERFLVGALKTMLDDLPVAFEDDAADILLHLKSIEQVPAESKGEANYILSKHEMKEAHFQKALNYALQVSEKDKHYFDAQYVAAIAEYELGHVDQSLARQHDNLVEIQRKGVRSDLVALFLLNMGREAFQDGRFKEAVDDYEHIPKNHPLWIQALTEQGWAQIQFKDASGAIGNMHSIQSPYFDGVYKPESYVVRTVGYLDICQYADAFKSLSLLEYKYQPWLDKLTIFNKKLTETQAYDVVITYLKGKATADVAGLPFQMIREAARQKEFLNLQEGVNGLIDEQSAYNFIRGLIIKDRKNLIARRNNSIARVAQLKLKIGRIEKGIGAGRDLPAMRGELENEVNFLDSYDFKVNTYKEGLEGFDRFTPSALKRINERKSRFKLAAGDFLFKQFHKMEKDLKTNLDNDELLKYEVYAGSGENLRYRIAGGKTGGKTKYAMDRHPSGEHWDFDGEFWEDEIGNYRSSLKNNCKTQRR